MKTLLPLFTAIAAGSLLSACEAPSGSDDVADLRAEIEQLENQLGRLEFRVYELEHAADSDLQKPAAGAEPATAQPVRKPPADADRYDLTPVE